MRYFTFNGKDSRNYFSLTNEIKRPYLPPIDVPSVKIPNRAGAVALKRNEVGVREFEIRATLLALNHAEVRSKVRALAEFLIYEEDKELIFSDELNRKYMARFSQDSTDLEEIAYTGEGVLKFIAYDPFAYSTVENNKTILVSNPNLLPAHALTDYTNWYNNVSFSSYTFADRTGVRVDMDNVTTNARMRVVTNSATDKRAPVTAGTTYTMSVVILATRAEMKTIEYAGVYYYPTDGTAPYWGNVFSANLVDLPYYNEAEGSRLYTLTFTAEKTGTVRLSFGFGLSNTGIDNDSWFAFSHLKLEQGDSMTETDKPSETEILNNGTAKTFPRIRVVPTSTQSYFSLVNVTTNKKLTYNATATANEALIFDLSENRVYRETDNTNLIKNVSLESDFFALEVGKNRLRVENADPKSLGITASAYWVERYW